MSKLRLDNPIGLTGFCEARERRMPTIMEANLLQPGCLPEGTPSGPP